MPATAKRPKIYLEPRIICTINAYNNQYEEWQTGPEIVASSTDRVRLLVNVGTPDQSNADFTCRKSGDWSGSLPAYYHWIENVQAVGLLEIECRAADGFVATSSVSIKRN